MRFLTPSLIIVAALVAVTACNSKSSSSSSDQSNASATTAAATSAAGTTSAAATSSAAGEVPAYPGAVTQASGSSSNMGSSAAGQVMTTDDSFDKVYTWYQQNMPAGSEKSHVTAPVESAVFMVGQPGQGQTSVTLTTSGGKTMITVAKVKM
ncbi:MAG: hypothetical protein JO190_07465 [Candidatus Eremiobacteraeota bacterium]|nr:hypothetical protein [Candidatus Eremiobacteraeota bacterium]MBV8497779.1 hypothetical protein [Candidatus Eremiobacteraeota bacterium]